MYIINNEVFLLYSTKYIMFIYTRLTSPRIFINCKLYKCAGLTPTTDQKQRKRLKEKIESTLNFSNFTLNVKQFISQP